ncbi:hypothetical protein RJ639_028603 [Escallonia herrerae]|uniref:Pseudouridine synthase I TruA alpha/beta domain-containing protein n=1 Tax=Escallonia herrerae TaxID=1293975 RepID=A0AA89BP84_9ASTE|nr:hypothetical protein RJ639_028603 [Escallonia herrerae]
MENPASSPQEPSSKKPKMSTTTSDDEDCITTTTADGGPAKSRYKRRKIAILFAYCGVGYQGMQKNPGAKTIEGDLEEALYQSGAVPEHDRGLPKRFDWARSARTDKGVSAVGQVVSGRFYIDPPGLIDRLNSNLPPQFRIFGFKRVTASFSAKKFCDRRRYVYLIPVFALDTSSHRDRESVLASLGSGNELVKCLECSERGRKVEGIMGKRSFESRSVVQPGISSNNGTALSSREENGTFLSHSEINNEIMVCGDNGNANSNILQCECVSIQSEISSNGEGALVSTEENGTPLSHTEEANVKSMVSSENGNANSNLVQYESVIEEREVGGELDGCGNGPVEAAKRSGFSYGEKERERFNRILKCYEGTHNFHNFTTRTKAEDPSARRYIISLEANTTVTVDGIDFVKCEVVGQSFMLHQIRKMIGVAVAIMRNCAPESLIGTALQKEVNINVPTAPEVGLYLDECFFTSYNQKWKDTHEKVSMKAYEEEAEEFKMNHIYSHIAATEHKEGVVALWLHSLNNRNYPDLRVISNDGKTDLNGAKAVDMAK